MNIKNAEKEKEMIDQKLAFWILNSKNQQQTPIEDFFFQLAMQSS